MSPKLFPKRVFLIEEDSGSQVGAVSITSTWVVDYDNPSVGINLDFSTMQLSGEMGVGALINGDIAPSYDVPIGIAPAVTNLDMTGGLNIGALVNGDIAPTYIAGEVGIYPEVNQIDMAAEPSVGTSPTLPEASMNGGVNVGAAMSTTVQWQTGEFLASKDSWHSQDALCTEDNNHDGEDLNVRNLVALVNRRTIFAFDLSGIPTNATLTDATLTLNVSNVINAAPVSANLSAHEISTGSEGWSETDIRCSNAPALGNDNQTLTIGNTTGEKVFTLSTDWHDKIESRFGTTACSFYLVMDNAGESREMQATDEGANDNLGPRLSLQFITTA